ncbi:hypothetical protein CcaverHIS002_0300360 [Cutaneotrichosporon cavernicola]|uniref:Uncharacterized protein n=1 Tax=Cutaneotrichosporon cavernicola TaxID=279322 RepID=A0AA48I2M3_9TREE|nr:uncharacterized protein CcaverHIS019_0300360 [Cutaneotrichosporon cavernicola]BEI82168.1 hypothetical protein CcaverHIS002_0300360 [Cutaneotrichosporon cavernicola]BEI89966.1 hypothetical protein CcaverHIS019_0300360 [Cutaneotrichosporon cavernicola]BEI97739.1 hypothetical protein CcaverHIS631_0300380 [Cutaneotrichosporon cavernicola]BEJ05516.1 hypothetical protein CcaverHIS641_0300380 [Cutaneotrichosporon cavernicola]
METATNVGEGYTYTSSSIVRVALAGGIIVLGVCALLLFVKISGWLRYRQRTSRERALSEAQDSEQRARAFELAAWADTPGQAPVTRRDTTRRRWWQRIKTKPEDKEKRRGLRGKTNAYAVYEWEGVPQ